MYQIAMSSKHNLKFYRIDNLSLFNSPILQRDQRSERNTCSLVHLMCGKRLGCLCDPCYPFCLFYIRSNVYVTTNLYYYGLLFNLKIYTDILVHLKNDHRNVLLILK